MDGADAGIGVRSARRLKGEVSVHRLADRGDLSDGLYLAGGEAAPTTIDPPTPPICQIMNDDFDCDADAGGTDAMDTATTDTGILTCARCGRDFAEQDLVSLLCHSDIGLCGVCIAWLTT